MMAEEMYVNKITFFPIYIFYGFLISDFCFLINVCLIK